MFFATSILMSVIASWSRTSHSILDVAPPTSTSAPASKTAPAAPGSLLDQLKQLQSQSGGGAPAAPAQQPSK
jgi:hypothetical protein